MQFDEGRNNINIKELPSYRKFLNTNHIQVRWVGEHRLMIEHNDKKYMRKINYCGLPYIHKDNNDSPIRDVLEYTTILKVVKNSVIEDFVDNNAIKHFLHLDDELLQEHIAELAMCKKYDVFCRCGDGAFILSPKGEVVSFCFWNLVMEKVNQLKSLCKNGQIPIQLKTMLSEAINIARMDYRIQPLDEYELSLIKEQGDNGLLSNDDRAD